MVTTSLDVKLIKKIAAGKRGRGREREEGFAPGGERKGK